MSEWVSVNDRLPWLKSRYLVFVEIELLGYGKFSDIRTASYWEHGWIVDAENEEESVGEVQYWMPLPEAPKEVTT